MPTIPKNAKRIVTLKEQLTACRVYTLANNFHGDRVDPAYAWDALARSRRAKLTADDAQTIFVVHVHDNCWYELREPAS